jgi:hypothetical protein
MPFGRYRGHTLADLPDSYVEWLLGLADLREPLRSAITAEWHRRCTHDLGGRFRPLPLDAMPIAESIITLGHRALTRQHHPDLAGGSTRAMQLVNLAADWLRAGVRGAA